MLKEEMIKYIDSQFGKCVMTFMTIGGCKYIHDYFNDVLVLPEYVKEKNIIFIRVRAPVRISNDVEFVRTAIFKVNDLHENIVLVTDSVAQLPKEGETSDCILLTPIETIMVNDLASFKTGTELGEDFS